MTDPAAPHIRQTLAVALEALREQVAYAVEENASGVLGPGPERLRKIRDAARAVGQLGLESWEAALHEPRRRPGPADAAQSPPQ